MADTIPHGPQSGADSRFPLSLVVLHCADRHGQPLATVDGFPGGSADMHPEQLRALALALLRVADDCDGRRETHVYLLTDCNGAGVRHV